MEYEGFTYTPTPKTAWDNLSMQEKSEMMRVAVRNGITDLKTIREKYNEFAEGGKIHIKDSKKGTFTAAASRHNMGIQEFASKVLANKDNYSPAMVRKANFARNASKWHGEGGNLFEEAGQMQIGRPFYSYDWNGNRITDASGNPILNYNITLPEVTIIPDSRLSPAERNYRERQRQKIFADYAEQNSKDYTTRQSITAQRQWENSPQKKALDLGIVAAQGIGMASDVVSPFFGGIPVYSGLKGAQALDRATNTNELGDYADAALWLSPMFTATGKRIYDTAKPAISEVYNRLVDNGTLWDAYTTFGGRFGNYGDNVFTNMYGTAARRFGLPDKARVPADGIRKIKEDPRIFNGMVDFTGDKNWYGNPHVNATIDRGVVSHSAGGWDGADTYLFPFRDFLAETKGSLKSIEPSDVFSNGVAFMESPSKVTLISGDVTALENAQKIGMQTLSSPRLRRLYSEAEDKYNANRLLNRHPKKEQYWKEYANEVQRLQSQRGVPTLDDFRLLEQTTGLKAGIAPLSEYENAIRGITEMQKTMHKPGGIRAIMSGEAVPYTYPNGREVDWTIQGVSDELNALQRAKYNNVFYDPTTYIESIWRSEKEPKW